MAVKLDEFSSSLDAVAIQAGDVVTVPHLITDMLPYLDLPINEHHRLHLLRIARLLVQALETPRETVIRLCWAEPTLYGAIIVAIDCGIFSYMSQTPNEPVPVEYLARVTEMDPILTSRLMKHLSAMGIFQESAPDLYLATNLSKALALSKYAGGFTCMAEGAMKAIYRLPEYFRSTGYRNPDEATAGPFQFAYETSQHWFQWVSERPAICQQFNHHMSAYHQGRPSWMDRDFYPVENALLNLVKPGPNAVLLVDIGGGFGHDLQEFHQKHPSAPGRLIVQDKADVIQQVPNEPGKVEFMAHDFFTEQPIKGARAYYLHSVLHDWPDAECRRILRHISDAMAPGYSKLLINENVVPDQKADWQITGLDLMLMTLASARERRESEWHQLLTDAGFMIVHIWSHINGGESLIECQLA
ncbi:O-methyltransferase, putative [Talaromyces stipitatus ATCC 10500]|uniref:O-methyltransferase, putative n=1 Tax=Talaromyces stipitatus (strain ATCC 10500 / CBS 375.48 / QM 6759 / NRRL 1006) TaxID=441959 RepID=B8LU32_TALSN|nr:O-methyltransferase, putative [Talaromyces stipitatus ATCC 10500]EED22504.1 O-methyltransferase, putative [Talaromyces stipitatus ATCC 10500]